MTIDQFAAMAQARRIPTPTEFKSFADAMGYRIARNGEGSPVLRVKDKTDPMARALARMLGREPWRSEVIKLAEGGSAAAAPEQCPPAATGEAPDPAPESPGAEVPSPAPAEVRASAEERVTVRAGVCVARADGWLAWASYRAGERYRFEEQRVITHGDYRTTFQVFGCGPSKVYDGPASGFAGPSKFAEMFEECGP